MQTIQTGKEKQLVYAQEYRRLYVIGDGSNWHLSDGKS